MKNKIIYIAGPITGMPCQNKENFARVQEIIERLGSKAINPHQLFENVDTTGFTHSDYMRYCLQALLNADLIVSLVDWQDSKGAKMEMDLARNVEIPTMHEVRFIAEANYLINDQTRIHS